MRSAQLPLLQSIGFGISELPAVKNTQYNEVYNTMRHRVFLPCLSFDLQSEIIVIATLADIMEHVTIFQTITSANVLQD